MQRSPLPAIGSGRLAGTGSVGASYACLIEGSPDTELVQGLALPATRRRVRQTANSAFLRTGFEDQLRAMNVTKLFLAGAFMDGCPL